MTPRPLSHSALAGVALLALSGCALDDGADDPDSSYDAVELVN